MELIIKPKEFKKVEQDLNGQEYNYARYELFPLEKGYAITIGNALRRVLLSSVPALAITKIRIPGKLHEFDVIDGVKEDILEMCLNLKLVQLKIDDIKELTKLTEEIELTINKKGPAKLTAGDIKTPAGVEIANPELVIADITSNVNVEIDLFATPGKGFVQASDIQPLNPQKDVEAKSDIEYIYLDGVYSPVMKVNYITENYRVGKITDYDKLILEIWTKKNIVPDEALKESTSLLLEHFNFIAKTWKDSAGEEVLEPVQDTGEVDIEDSYDSEADALGVSREILDTSIDNLDLTKRAKNCLKRERINTVGELFKKTPEELMKIKNFGKKSLDEIRKELKDKFDVDYDILFDERRSSN
ncbi:MAG: DNA-directed RNA polymerase subunit alpha [Thermotogae bacterium]|nr:DNA-directed RNA polymerase subunit alpha [Thermotogota bacterium]